MLLIAAHEADHRPARSLLYDADEALAHQLLELHALLNDRRAPAALQKRLLDTREAAPQHADDQVILEVRLARVGPLP